MHRILNIAGNHNNNNDLIEQPPAGVVYITSVKADLNLLANLVNKDIGDIRNNLRALHISLLESHSQIDHYIEKTINYSKVVVVRLFGDKGKWGYGIEQLRIWQMKSKKVLIILSGTKEQDIELNELSSIDSKLAQKLSLLLRAGGSENYLNFLHCINCIYNDRNVPKKFINEVYYPDPYLYDWREEIGDRVGIISYKSLYLANETDLTDNLNKSLRNIKISPKTIFVSTLKDIDIQKQLIHIFKKEKIKLIITTTSFDSCINSKGSKYSNINFFEELNVPVLQILTSNINKISWEESTFGLNSLDLLMQIIIPEFDGRIISIPCAFKEIISVDNNICCELTKYKYHKEGLSWLIKFVENYIKLNKLNNFEKRIVLVLSNYPIKNGRIGNGVGLNTPKSIINILKWLKNEGYDTGDTKIPKETSELMSLLIKGRTNSPDSFNNKPLDFLTLNDYQIYWEKIPIQAKNKILNRWNIPSMAEDLENQGYSINGIKFGKICLLIQPQRGYDPYSNKDIHSPDLPPPHRYLAQYYWIINKFKANAICHIGKHGTLEWLPGKSIGLSNNCFPQLICPPIPIIYPFIVNDPGEGSQAKRRTHSTIIDHLTPPLDRADLYGYLSKLEILIDEYYEAKLLDSKRINVIEKSIFDLIKNNLKNTFDIHNKFNIEEIDSYLCELKESQIRVGLHTFGERIDYLNEINLILCIAKVPTSKRVGITQFIANILKLDLDPWTSDYDKKLTNNDLKILNYFSNKNILNFRNALDYLEEQSKYIIYYFFYKENNYIYEIEKFKNENLLKRIIIELDGSDFINIINKEIYIPIIQSPNLERHSFIRALNGEFIKSGPSGAPTRGKIEVIPTGKNFYSVDTRNLPTESAWIVGRKSAIQILDLYKLDNGEDLKKIAISLWATSTMRNGGEDICQILYLMGIQPIWDSATRRIIDLDILPINILDRPRVDVTVRISGMFRDAFPQLIEILSTAIKLISILDEDYEYNQLARDYKNKKSISRIFGSAPGSYGAGLQELISNSSWSDINDLGDAYLSWSCWIYDERDNIKYGKKELEKELKKTQLVVHNQDNKEHDILDSDDYYQFQGGLSSAIKKLTGKFPELYHGDLSKFGHSKIKKLSFEINKVIQSRVLNPKWIDGMLNNGYKGAFEFSATLDYLYAYDATTNLVTDSAYQSIYDSWIVDEKIINFLEEKNPWALKDITERFLEIINRGMWNANSKEILNNLKNILIKIESKIEKNNF